MRLLSLPLPVILSTIVLAQHHAHAHPARHNEMARRYERELMIDMAKRQRGATTTTTPAGDADDDDGLLGGILGGSEAVSSTTVLSTTRGVASSAIPTTSATRTTGVLPSVTELSASAVPTSIISSSSAVGSASSVSNGTAVASSSASSIAASSSSLAPSSAAPSEAQASDAVTTVTTDAGGSVKVVTQFLTAAPSASADGAKPSESSDKSKDDGGISIGAIIGISVAAGVVVLSLIGCAIWRMKRRGSEEDDAIRWPELNRHGDSDTHHALPARQTGQHGIETGLERSISNSSSIFAPSTHAPPSAHSAHMALGGSNFGATSSLEDYQYDEKTSVPPLPPLPGHPAPPYDAEEDYANMPPAVQMQQAPSGGAYGGYDSEEEARHGAQMNMAQSGAPATYYHGHGH